MYVDLSYFAIRLWIFDAMKYLFYFLFPASSIYWYLLNQWKKLACIHDIDFYNKGLFKVLIKAINKIRISPFLYCSFSLRLKLFQSREFTEIPVLSQYIILKILNDTRLPVKILFVPRIPTPEVTVDSSLMYNNLNKTTTV